MIDDHAIGQLRADFAAALAAVRTDRDLQALRDRYLGRRGGTVTALYSRSRPRADERRRIGQLANELKDVGRGRLGPSARRRSPTCARPPTRST